MNGPAIPVLKSHLMVNRYLRRLTQQQLAEQTGISRRTVHDIEVEKAIPSVLTALRLAEVLEISVHDLFEIKYVLSEEKAFTAAYTMRAAIRHTPKLYGEHLRRAARKATRLGGRRKPSSIYEHQDQVEL